MRNAWLFLSVRLWLSLISLQNRLILSLIAILSAAPLSAQANDGFFGMFDGVADDARKSAKGLLSIAFFIGIILVMVGIFLWVAKKKNPQIGWGWILTPLGAGFVLIALDQFIKKGQSTIKLNPVDVS
jgi:hypothetical protein